MKMTRRRAIEAAFATTVAFGMSGCRRTVERPRLPAPTLGWETIASGDDGPGPRSRHSLVFDKKANAMVLFGGIVWGPPAKLRSDTWELRDRQWMQVETSASPPARHRGAMVYLDDQHHSVLFGGQGPTGAMLGDTWIYTGQGWRKALLAVEPEPRCGHSFAFDSRSGVAVLFGGIATTGQSLADTWVLDKGFWRQVTGTGPAKRRYAAFAYDPELGGCVLHGGSEDDIGRHSYGDAWLFRDDKWTRLDNTFDTEPRDDHGLAYHQATKKLVMLEGIRAKRGLLVRDPNGWRTVEVNPLHPRHQCSPLVWDESLGGLLIHGGEARHKGPQFDTTLLLHLPVNV
jgi:hypothetical protein